MDNRHLLSWGQSLLETSFNIRQQAEKYNRVFSLPFVWRPVSRHHIIKVKIAARRPGDSS